jgi:hypothetical protein
MHVEKTTHLLKLHTKKGLMHSSIQTGREKMPGCGARGVGPPPLISTSFVTRRGLIRAITVAKQDLKVKANTALAIITRQCKIALHVACPLGSS